MSPISNYTRIVPCDVITRPFPNFACGLIPKENYWQKQCVIWQGWLSMIPEKLFSYEGIYIDWHCDLRNDSDDSPR